MSFEEIYSTYWQKVFRLSMGYVNDIDKAKDLSQETFIAVWQNLSKFRNESSIGTWIFRIASNHCLRLIEKERKMPKGDMPEDLKEEINNENEGKKDFLYKSISELPETDRIIISLELEEIKQSEIAEILGLSEANVRVRIHRIKEKLTKKFESYDD
ncbi:MAG TPA: sigma-70 family RNA polymerase sigma factor [Ignavibacteria bacterium]|nr:sigma-70 family RNA polymerase sigma factor [Ignavibacteria bacterium]HMR39329.1 sigma-70 family RNA polymerase sigma factor [Ignavibacteria bacterium]